MGDLILSFEQEAKKNFPEWPIYDDDEIKALEKKASLDPVLASFSLKHYSLLIIALVSGPRNRASLLRGLNLRSLSSDFSSFRKRTVRRHKYSPILLMTVQ